MTGSESSDCCGPGSLRQQTGRISVMASVADWLRQGTFVADELAVGVSRRTRRTSATAGRSRGSGRCRRPTLKRLHRHQPSARQPPASDDHQGDQRRICGDGWRAHHDGCTVPGLMGSSAVTPSTPGRLNSSSFARWRPSADRDDVIWSSASHGMSRRSRTPFRVNRPRMFGVAGEGYLMP